jgi:hypoxanthine-guanine phosphoribosyltransferase
VECPPTKLQTRDDLLGIAGEEVLIIEDDVIGGGTLRIVIEELLKYKPRNLSLFLGHGKVFQHLDGIPREIGHV